MLFTQLSGSRSLFLASFTMNQALYWIMPGRAALSVLRCLLSFETVSVAIMRMIDVGVSGLLKNVYDISGCWGCKNR